VKSYLEVSITASESQRELLIPTMVELGCRGFQETDGELLCYFAEEDSSAIKKARRQQINGLRDGVGKVIRTISSNADVRFRTIREENWNAQWERTVQPIEIGKRIVIKPSWAEYENKNNRIVIQIDPKMSFGTGYHETTRLVLRLMERCVDAGYLMLDAGKRTGFSMLDVGTGTGILAIAAVRFGAANAAAIDNDPWSIDNATENVRANGVEDSVTIANQPMSAGVGSASGGNQFTDRRFDLITANITLNTIVELLPEMIGVLHSSGTLLLSGFLKTDLESLTRALSENKLKIVETLSENEWIAVAARL